WDYFSNDGNPDDEQDFMDGRHSHGTKVAGIIGALRNNGIGVAGIAGGNGFGNNGVELFALKVGGATGGYPTDRIVEAIMDAATSTAQYGFGCHVINMSFGSYNFSASMRGALSTAMLNNVVLVASKGNDNSTSRHYPSDYDKTWMLSVGASDHEDKRASFSNYNNDIDFVAPGVTSLVQTTSRTEVVNFSSFSGTSAAVPHVAGLAALLLSARPDLHPEEVQGIIKATADRVRTDLYTYDSTGWNNQLGHGRINAGRALEVLTPPWSLTRLTVRGGTSSNAGVSYDIPVGAIWGWGNLVYGYRTRVRNTVTFPSGYTSGPYVFGRGTNASEGWNSVEPVTMVDYCGVVSSTSSSAILETYVYEVYEYDYATGWEYGHGWYPTEPWNAVCAYSILGVAAPARRLVAILSPIRPPATSTWPVGALPAASRPTAAISVTSTTSSSATRCRTRLSPPAPR
ncbi:MAG TPA: S8 family serine peptidase, partial [Thermoanaerobaculia bacterium]|nr:S8 family serine peptidase [Thermoanaerobaculia bacterium]